MYDNFWFENLNKPLFMPPAEVFAPAWTVLYILMALALLFYLRTGFSAQKIVPLICFFVQLLFNLAWAPVFFGLQMTTTALIFILLMIIFTFFTIYFFYQYSKFSAYAMTPYLIWLFFAFYLNYGIVILN